jgi:hypothetical protein
VKVSQRTLYRWLREPDFSRAYRRARRDAFGQAIALTQRYAPLAVNTLVVVMADKDAPHHAKVSAATKLLRFGREGIERSSWRSKVRLQRVSIPENRPVVWRDPQHRLPAVGSVAWWIEGEGEALRVTPHDRERMAGTGLAIAVVLDHQTAASLPSMAPNGAARGDLRGQPAMPRKA